MELGARELIAIVGLFGTFLVILVRISFFASKTRAAAEGATNAIERIRGEIADSLTGVREAMESVRDVSKEALRQAQAAHARIDKLGHDQQRLDRDFIRLNERTRSWLKTTQKFHPEDEES